MGGVLGWNIPPKHPRLFAYMDVMGWGEALTQTVLLPMETGQIEGEEEGERLVKG